MKKIALLFGVLCMQCYCVGQAPFITYSGGAQSYFTGTAISPLTPTNSGGVIPATIYGRVTTFAGSGTGGSTNATGTAASFYRPAGVTVDALGNLFVADQVNHMIRKITPTGIVTTLAGSETSGAVDGTGTAASFSSPRGVTVDATGNVYVADTFNNKIRKITPLGVVTTLAGSGTAGSTNAAGTLASFNRPHSVAVDASGNVYVADYTNNKIRKITPGGLVSTLAGSGTAGAANGTGTAASFNLPYGVAVDVSGNVYVADSSNNIIRKINSSGVVTTLAGSGAVGAVDATGTTASFALPVGLVVDASGNVYVGDANNDKIRKITQLGVVTTLAGSGTAGAIDAIGTAASFFRPGGVAVDASGNLYVADFFNHKIRKIAVSGYTISTALPAGLSFDGTTGIISGTPTVVTAATTYTITAYNASGSSVTTVSIKTVMLPNISYSGGAQTYVVGTAISPLTPNSTGSAIPASIFGQVTTFAGSGTAGSTNALGVAASFNFPIGAAVDVSGNMYVGDFNSHKIRKITSAGVVTTFAGSGTAGSTNGTGTAASFYNPSGVTIDASGNVFVAEKGSNKIRKITPAGVVTTLAGSGTAGSANGSGAAASFNFPIGVTIDAFGNVYVADQYNHKIRKITSAGVVTTLAGSGTAGATDGTGTAASFNYPFGVAVDATGNVYVSDENHKIRKISPVGLVTTFAGSGVQGATNGNGTEASFSSPTGMTFDASGNMYVAEYSGNKIRKITQSGVVTTLAGSGAQGSTDAIGTAASFNNPTGLAIDASGNLYVGDSSSNKIRKISAVGYGISPSLPAGLSFDATTGTISGTPITVTVATLYTITAYNTSGSSSTTVTIATCSALITPTFAEVATVCYGENFALPTTSNNSITGTWSPALNNTTTTTYTFTPTVGQCATTNVLTITVGCTFIVNLKLLIEGYYEGTTMKSVMNNQDSVSPLTDVENITVELHNTTSPWALVASATALLKTDGTAVCTFNTAPSGSYYIAVKGNSMVQTWSATPQIIGSTQLIYDFTNTSSQAYGNNMIEVEPNVWAFFSGDVNQDGNIDNSDYSIWETDANNFAFGFFTTDLNGDGNVDNSDYSNWEQNSNNFIFSVHP
jgi:sugar lactone lactonase YvrE